MSTGTLVSIRTGRIQELPRPEWDHAKSRTMVTAYTKHAVEGYSESEAERQHVLEEVQRQVIAFTIVLSDQFDDWRRGFPELDMFVQERFRPLAEMPVDEERTSRVLVHAGLPPSRVDAATGWPCFRL